MLEQLLAEQVEGGAAVQLKFGGLSLLAAPAGGRVSSPISSCRVYALLAVVPLPTALVFRYPPPPQTYTRYDASNCCPSFLPLVPGGEGRPLPRHPLHGAHGTACHRRARLGSPGRARLPIPYGLGGGFRPIGGLLRLHGQPRSAGRGGPCIMALCASVVSD